MSSPKDGGAATSSAGTSHATKSIFAMVWSVLAGYGVYTIGLIAYKIRLRAIEDYGPVIHEFDPYFNYRATEVRKKIAASIDCWFLFDSRRVDSLQ